MMEGNEQDILRTIREKFQEDLVRTFAYYDKTLTPIQAEEYLNAFMGEAALYCRVILRNWIFFHKEPPTLTELLERVLYVANAVDIFCNLEDEEDGDESEVPEKSDGILPDFFFPHFTEGSSR